MSPAKRTRWTEEDVDALPEGEHDYFERKSGDIFKNHDQLLGTLGKALSAFANSGGGHLILGVRNDGAPDGVPATVKGHKATKEWLEQKAPFLLDYPLSDFRVHVVEPAVLSRIPPGCQVVVVDVGDSPLAPHQCATGAGGARDRQYYYRQAGHSVPAPHFYLELLRQRLVSPSLAAVPLTIGWTAAFGEDAWWINFTLSMKITNEGRVAAYHWELNREIRPDGETWPTDLPQEAVRLEHVGEALMPFARSQPLLPGCSTEEELHWSVRVERASNIMGARSLVPLLAAVGGLNLSYRLATETSPGEPVSIRLHDMLNPLQLSEDVWEEIKDRYRV